MRPVSVVALLLVSTSFACATPDNSTGPEVPAEEVEIPVPREYVSTPFEASTEEAQFIQKFDENLDYYTSSIGENCGVEVEVDYGSFAESGKLSGLPSTAASACQGAFMGAGEVCSTDKRAAFVAKVTKIACQHVTTRNQAGLSIEDGVFVTRVVVENTGAGGEVAEYFAPTRVDTLNFLESNL